MNTEPHVVISEDPEFGIVADNRHHTQVTDHVLKRVGFQPLPGTESLYALPDPDRDGTRRAQQAVQALRSARYTVSTAPAFEPAPRHDQDSGPDVAFGLHPDLGVVAAVTDHRASGAAILAQHGFRHVPTLDIHTLPPGTEHHQAVRAVAHAARQLHQTGLSVAADPRIVLPPSPPAPADSPSRTPSPPPAHNADHPSTEPEPSPHTARAQAARAVSPRRPETAAPANPPPAPAPGKPPPPPHQPRKPLTAPVPEGPHIPWPLSVSPAIAACGMPSGDGRKYGL